MSAAPNKRKARRRWIWGSILGVVVLAAAFQALTAKPRALKPYLAATKPVVLGHQGASGEAPSNTIESFTLARQEGADILELDVNLTKDGQVVVSHDTSIDRMSNGKGEIKDLTLEQLRQFDFGWGFTPDDGKTYPYRGKGVKIPTLEEVFKAFPGVPVNIEIKQIDPAMEQQVLDVIRRFNMEDKVLINSFPSEPTQRWLQVAGDRSAIGADKADMIRFAVYWIPHLDWLYHPDRDCFQIPVSQKVGPFEIRLDTPRLIKTAHRLGIKVHYWTINDEAEMKHLIEIGADGLITDFPGRAVKVLQEMGYR